MTRWFRLTLVVILLLTIVAAWVVWPANPGFNLNLGPFNIAHEIKVHEGLDLQGGLQVLLQAKTPDGQPPAPEDLEATRFIIENRVNGLGVSEPLIQIQGADKIVVELPGVSDPDAAIKTFGQTGRLEFVDAGDTVLSPGQKVQTTYPNLWPVPADQLTTTPPVSSTSTISGTSAISSTAQAPAPKFATVVTGEHLRSAELAFQQTTNAPLVSFTLTPDGAKRFSDYSSKNIGK